MTAKDKPSTLLPDFASIAAQMRAVTTSAAHVMEQWDQVIESVDRWDDVLEHYPRPEEVLASSLVFFCRDESRLMAAEWIKANPGQRLWGDRGGLATIRQTVARVLVERKDLHGYYFAMQTLSLCFYPPEASDDPYLEFRRNVCSYWADIIADWIDEPHSRADLMGPAIDGTGLVSAEGERPLDDAHRPRLSDGD